MVRTLRGVRLRTAHLTRRRCEDPTRRRLPERLTRNVFEDPAAARPWFLRIISVMGRVSAATNGQLAYVMQMNRRTAEARPSPYRRWLPTYRTLRRGISESAPASSPGRTVGRSVGESAGGTPERAGEVVEEPDNPLKQGDQSLNPARVAGRALCRGDSGEKHHGGQ
jgi:hypothetical protein